MVLGMGPCPAGQPCLPLLPQRRLLPGLGFSSEGPVPVLRPRSGSIGSVNEPRLDWHQEGSRTDSGDKTKHGSWAKVTILFLSHGFSPVVGPESDFTDILITHLGLWATCLSLRTPETQTQEGSSLLKFVLGPGFNEICNL